MEFYDALCAKDEIGEDNIELRQMREETKEKRDNADILSGSAHGTHDNCKSCQHWNSLETIAAVHLIHFSSDELLTAAQMSALANAAVAVDYRCLSCWSCNSCHDNRFELHSLSEELSNRSYRSLSASTLARER